MVRGWLKKTCQASLQLALSVCRHDLEGRLLVASTIESYLNGVKLFLEHGEIGCPFPGRLTIDPRMFAQVGFRLQEDLANRVEGLIGYLE